MGSGCLYGVEGTTPITVLAGYGILMVAAQLPLLPRYLSLPFSLGTWAFSWAAVASAGLFWIRAGHPVGEQAWSYLALTAITVLVGAVLCPLRFAGRPTRSSLVQRTSPTRSDTLGRPFSR